MKTYIIIGGIGSGKSTVARMFGNLGAVVFDLDTIGHECTAKPEVAEKLVEAFGDTILDAKGVVDEQKLARAAFVSSQSIAALEAITHPAIAHAIQEELDYLAETGTACTVVEASAYKGPGGAFDWLIDEASGIIAVVAPEDIRLERAIAAGFTEQDARARMQQQATDSQRRAWADYVIENKSTKEYLEAQVEDLWYNTMCS